MKAGGIDRALADRFFDGVLQIDGKGRVTCWNRAAERITGYQASQVIGRDYRQNPIRHVDENGAELADALNPLLLTSRDARPRETVGYFNHADGYPLRTLARTEPVCDRLGKPAGALEIFTDNKAIIAAFQSSQRTDETVHFDLLTGIGNRPHIEARIRAAISDFRLRQRPFGILFIDIDHFKDFNDSYGHLLGDKILKMAATTLRQKLRGSDSCGRWGGEEFIALAYDLDSAGLAKVAEKLRQSVAAATVRQNEQDLGVTISIGATLIRAEDTFQSLVERADQLMYESKRQGRNRVTVDSS